METGRAGDEMRKKYGSHLSVLMAVYDAIRPSIPVDPTVLELGPGDYSTEFFAEHSSLLFTVETSDPHWGDLMVEKYRKNKHVMIYTDCKPDVETQILLKLIEEKKTFDIAFVDSNGPRHIDAVLCSYLAPIVICHDSEECTSWYQTIPVRDQWHVLDIQDFEPWTMVYTCVPGLVESLKKSFSRIFELQDPTMMSCKPLLTAFGRPIVMS